MTLKKTLIDGLYDAAEESNNGITFIRNKYTEEKLTYQGLFTNSQKILKHLQARGLKKGDKVIIHLDDNKYFVQTYWACILGGIIPVPLEYRNTKEHINKLLNVCSQLVDFIIVIQEQNFIILKDSLLYSNDVTLYNKLCEKILLYDDICEDIGDGDIYNINKDDIAFIQYSSGSTGSPKGVVLTHENLSTNILGIINTAKISKDDIYLSWMPLYHDMGLIGLHLVPVFKSGNLYNMSPSTFIRNPFLWLDKASEKKATTLASPNFGYKYLLSKLKDEKIYEWNLENVRLIFNGAEPISVKLCQDFLSKLERYNLKKTSMYPVYGLAEASLAVAFPKPGIPIKSIKVSRKYLNIGQKIVKPFDSTDSIEFAIEGHPVEGCKFRVVDFNNQLLPQNHIGNIQIRGKNVTHGYYKASDNNQSFSHDGWLRTGDLGFITEDQLVVTGRDKDVIIVQGQNYYLYDIERSLEFLDGIFLDGVVACKVNSNENQDLLVIFVKYRIFNNKFINLYMKIIKKIAKDFGITVHSVIPINTIPRTSSGKIQRYKLAKLYFSEEIQNLNNKINQMLNEEKMLKYNSHTNDSYVEKTLIKIWQETLGIEEVSANDNLFDLGGSSMLLAELVSNINKKFATNIKISDLLDKPTINEISDLIIIEMTE